VRVEATPALKPSALIHNIHIVEQYVKVGPVWLPLYNRSMSDSFFFGHTGVTIDSSDYQVTQKPIEPPAQPSAVGLLTKRLAQATFRGSMRERMDQRDVYSVAFSLDGSRLVTAGGDFFSSSR
jgi:hypothetical protein